MFDFCSVYKWYKNQNIKHSSLPKKDSKLLKLIIIDSLFITRVFLFNLIACFYEFERDLIRERTLVALESKRKRGLMGGRPKISPVKIKKALEDYKSEIIPINEILNTYGIGKSTFYRYLNLSKKSENW